MGNNPLHVHPTSSVELDKRTHLPFILRCTCDKCGQTIEQDLSDDRYLSYPQVGAVGAAANPPSEPITMYCIECDHEQRYEICVRVVLEVL